MEYRTVIVDDEAGVLSGLKFLIEKYVPECCVEAVAYNGEEGAGLISALQPDIVITDIRMPVLDGIEMISRLKDQGIKTHFVVLSGFAEFEYARSAMQLGVRDYITKPVDEQELKQVLGRLCKRVEQERSRERRREALQGTVRDYLLKDVLEGKYRNRKEILEQLSSVGFLTAERQYACVLLDTGWEIRTEETNREETLYKLSERLSKRYFDFCSGCHVLKLSDTGVVLALTIGKETEQKKINNRTGRMRLELAEEMDQEISAGISMLHLRAEEISQAFEEARCALNYKILRGADCCICYEEIKSIEPAADFLDAEDIEAFEKAVDTGEEKQYRKVVDIIFDKLERKGNLSMQQLQILCLNLLLTGLRKMPFMQFQINEYLGRNIFSLESIAQFQTIRQLRNWIINCLNGMNELMLKESVPKKRDLVEDVKKYIHKNFNRDITLNEISERFFINPYYFSQLFKKKTGMNYQNYLTQIRINRAKKLLEETNMKLGEICAMVGYTDSNHFNRMFERQEGMNPAEYRKKFRKPE